MTTNEMNENQVETTSKEVFPDDFLEMVESAGFEALAHVLKEAKPGSELDHMLYAVQFLGMLRRMKRGSLPDWDVNLTSAVSQVVWGVSRLGGRFGG